MFKKISLILLFALIISSVITFSSCKDKNQNDPKSVEKANRDLIINNNNELSVNLKYVPKLNEKFHYKMIAKTSNASSGTLTKNTDLKEEQDITYYYTQEVVDINQTGYLTFKMNYDSIIIVNKRSIKDSTASQVYNSNIQDSVYKNPDFIQYNALIGSVFKFRISPKGEVQDVTELEQIHDKIFKLLGDTLKNKEKEEIKKMMGAEALQSLIQNQFQKFPESSVKKDSVWSYTDEANLSLFPVRNNMSYKLTGIDTTKNIILNVDATLGIDFLSKTEKENGTTVKLKNESAGGSGTITIDLSRGCILKKDTQTSINMDLTLSGGGQTATLLQNLKTIVSIELLNI